MLNIREQKKKMIKRCVHGRVEKWTIVFALTIMHLISSLPLYAGEIEEIRELYKNVNEIVSKGNAKEIFLYVGLDPSDYNWYEADKKNLDKNFNRSEFRAKVYLHKGRLIKAVLETLSPSGDWKSTEEYYFYESGKTAFYFQSLVTYQGYDYDKDQELPPGPYIVEKRIYFNRQGKQIKKLTKAFVSLTKKEIPEKYVRHDLPIDIYPDIRALPFYEKVSSRVRG